MNGSNQVLLATAVISISHNNEEIYLKALLDQGSMTNLITNRACQLLGIKGKRTFVPITGLGGTRLNCARELIQTNFKSQCTNYELGLTLELKLNKTPGLRENYDKCIQEYLDLNQMELADETLVHVNYLPHHPVFRETSSTTKIRPVFDGSCASTNENSLNSQLLTGPTIQPERSYTPKNVVFHCATR